jgi:uncharacterized repeat protein (TIGR01451 family)
VTYNAVTGVITVPAGVSSFTVSYPTLTDALADTGETTALTVGGVTGVGTINDPANPTLTVGSNSVVEGTNLVHAVTLSAATTQPATYPFTLVGTTATAGTDFTNAPASIVFTNGVTLSAGVITVPAGVTNFTVSYPTTVDALAEGPETTALTIGGSTGVGTINDPGNPIVSSVSPATAVEGTNLVHTVTLSAPTTQPATYPFTLTGTTATAGVDFTATAPVFTNGVTYNAVTGVITVPAGVSSFTVSYPTIIDTLAEGSETTALTVGGITGVGTIVDGVYLSVDKTASRSPLVVGLLGQYYTISIAISNGPTTAPITIADVMPTGITLSAVPTAVGGVMTGCPVTGTSLAGCTIAANATGTIVITVPVNVDANSVSTAATNRATVSGGGDVSCPSAAHCTGTVTLPVVAPDMQVVVNTKLPPAIKGVAYPAGQTISCTNISTVEAANAFCTITDLPPGLSVACTPTSPVASLAPGASIVCTISGTPSTNAPINAKVVTGAIGDSVAENNNGTLISQPAVGLVVAKTVSANPLLIDGTNQYYSISITVSNGPTLEPITLSDDFASGIKTSGSVTITGGQFKAGTCAAANGTGVSSLTGCVIEPGVSDVVYIRVPISVDDSAEGPTGGNNTVIASGGGDPTCPQAGNCVGSTGAVAVEYSDLGSLFIRKTVDKTTVEIGDVLTYQLTVRSTRIKGAAIVNDKLPLGFTLISNSVRVSSDSGFTAASNPAGAPGPNLAFSINIPAKNRDVVIEYKVRVGMGADRGDGINQAQATMRSNKLQSLVAKAKVKVTGGVFTREACIVGKVYADCNGNNLQDVGEPGIPNIKLYLENGTGITTDENGQYSICGVRAITHVLKIDATTLPVDSKLAVTSNRNVGDPNTIFVDVIAGELHNADFRIEGCTPAFIKSLESKKYGVSNTSGSRLPAPGNLEPIQFDSSKPVINGSRVLLPDSPNSTNGAKK